MKLTGGPFAAGGLPPKPEKAVQAELRDYLTLTLGAVVVRVNSGVMPWTDNRGRGRRVAFNDSPGCSDLIVCLKGSFIACEVKKPGGKLTPKQAAFLDRVRKAGGLAVCVASLAELKAALAAEGLV